MSIFRFAQIGCFIASCSLLSGEVLIAEFDAINGGTASDADENSRDWLELHNTETRRYRSVAPIAEELQRFFRVIFELEAERDE